MFINFYSTFLSPLAQKINHDEIFTRAAAVAYSASLSFAPVVILLTSVMGFLRLDIIHYLAIQTNRLIGYEMGELVLRLSDYSQQNVEVASFSGFIGFGILIVSGSFFFRQVEKTMAHIFKDFSKKPKENQSYWKQVQSLLSGRLASFVIFCLALAFTLVSLLSSFYLKNILSHHSPAVYGLIYELSSFLLFAFLFYTIFLCTPALYIPKRIVAIGSLITALLFLVGKELIAVYISTMGVGSVYGATGTIVVFLVWFYYSSLTVFIGAEIITVMALPNHSLALKNNKIKS